MSIVMLYISLMNLCLDMEVVGGCCWKGWGDSRKSLHTAMQTIAMQTLAITAVMAMVCMAVVCMAVCRGPVG